MELRGEGHGKGKGGAEQAAIAALLHFSKLHGGREKQTKNGTAEGTGWQGEDEKPRKV